MAATGYRYLDNLPNVRGGNAIVDGTRIGVHDVVGLIVNGSSVDDERDSLEPVCVKDAPSQNLLDAHAAKEPAIKYQFEQVSPKRELLDC